MKKRYFSTIFAAIFLLMMTSCVREQFAPGGLTGGEGYLYLTFGSAPNVEVSTKATLKAESENRIMNLYVFVFDKDGHKIHSKWYSELERTNSKGELDVIEEGWYRENSSQSDQPSIGVIKIKSPAGSGFKIYVFANIDGDMVKISSEMLSHNINTEADINNFQVYLNQETTSRNGYFPMSGSISGVTVGDGGGITISGGGSGSLILRRMDAKIKFTFKTGTRPDENGQVIQSFEPKGWRVFNIPKTAFLMERNEDACSVDPNTPTEDYSQYASLFFDSEWANFEEFPDQKTSSFSFYMPENRQTPKNSSFTNYQDRSRQKKTATGLNEVQAVEYTSLSGKTSTKSMRIFQNANDFSTYVLVSAKVIMKLTGSEAGQTLGGDVLYLIHLGDWTSNIHNGSSEHWNDDEYSNVANFQTRRNTSYNYTVTVNSVNNIRIEVETSDGENIENQPGASGQITIAKEEIAICDAHYEAKTMTFSAKNFFEGTTATADDLTWRVSTPFGEGSPSIGHDGEDIPAGLDYKWVHFRLNKKDASTKFYKDIRRRYTNRAFAESSTFRSAADNKESDGSNDPGLEGYHNDGVMDIIDMVKYIKTQVKRYASWLENGGNYADYKCDFDSENLNDAKICVTVFVDEYYYDKDPIFGGSSPTLWKRFVNKEERAMHILCNSNTSKDLESRATGSVITIQQKPIKSIYNTDESYTKLQNAWGLESVDEHADKVFTYNQNKDDKNGSGNNNDEFNGLANSIFEWGLAPNGTTVSNITTIENNIRWDKYLSFEVRNELPQLKDGYESLRYICMSRNRDNNGNGVIDRDEIRWYLASVRQLIGMYVGDGVLESSVRIYNRSTADRNSDDPARWRQHVISSTKYLSDSEPTVIWGEEGISTGNISGSLAEGNTKFTVRCVRNLGMANDAPINKTPDDYIQYSKNADGSYTFECTHINESALRYYSSRELDYEDERATANCLYKKFETAPADQSWTSGAVSFKALNDEVSKYGSSVYAGYCPDGYRLPSQTELAVMRYYMELTGTYPSRTFWSFGVEALGGSGKDGGNKYGFCTHAGNITLWANATFSTARCVRDVRVE